MLGRVMVEIFGNRTAIHEFPTFAARATPFAGAFEAAAAEHGVDAALLRGIACKESSMRPEVMGPVIPELPGVRAVGLMQVLNSETRFGNLFDPNVNVRAGATILREKMNAADGSLRDALYLYGGHLTALRQPGKNPTKDKAASAYVRDILSYATLFKLGR